MMLSQRCLPLFSLSFLKWVLSCALSWTQISGSTLAKEHFMLKKLLTLKFALLLGVVGLILLGILSLIHI